MTPPGHVRALDVEALLDPAVSFVGARRSSELLGVGALKELDHLHGELKSMHTRESARGQGVGRAIVEHLLGISRRRGYQRVSLETGTFEAFTAARSLSSAVGFEVCEPFAGYTDNTYSLCMTLALSDELR